MTQEQKFWRFWLGGLALFALAIVLGLLITRNGVTWGIIEHQSAGSAARVDEIQASWKAGGVRGIAIAAMLADLVFIGVYGFGSYLGGRLLARQPDTVVRWVGAIATVAAGLFIVMDYTETILQFIQLVSDRGVDWMAQTAATVRPVKVAAWMTTFFAIIGGFAIRRIWRSAS